METAIKDSIELRGKTKPEIEVNKIRSEDRKQRKCYRFGKDDHNESDCYFKEQYCRNCEKKGHIKRVYVAPSQPAHLPQPRMVHLKRKGQT